MHCMVSVWSMNGQPPAPPCLNDVISIQIMTDHKGDR